MMFSDNDINENSVKMLGEHKTESMENNFLHILYDQGIGGSSAERLAKILTLINDIMHRHPFTRQRWTEVVL